MKYQVGDLVKVKQLEAWDKVDKLTATPGMASLSGTIGIVRTVDDDHTVQIFFRAPHREFNDYWFATDMIELADPEEE